MTAPERTDHWDLSARRAANRKALVDVASAFLEERNDQALGLAPARFLPPNAAPLWILYWCAARRVDDSIEEHDTQPAEWLGRLGSPGGETLAERCVTALRSARELEAVDLDTLLARSLAGVAQERTFDRPRPWTEYLALLDLKSTPTMELFDALLAPNEDPAVRTAHARAFAASAQIGDDCRDAFHDLQRGRCFVTLDELGNTNHPAAFAKTERFSVRRAELCRTFLHEATEAAGQFNSREARTGAAHLHELWKHAIESGQIRPTAKHLAVPRTR